MFLTFVLSIAVLIFLGWCVSRILGSYCEKNYKNPDDAKKALGSKVGKIGIICMIISAAFMLFSISNSSSRNGSLFAIIMFLISVIIGFSGGLLQVKGEEKEREEAAEIARKKAAEDRARAEALEKDPVHIMIKLKHFEQQYGINSSVDNLQNVNTNHLRSDLMDYYGTAMHSGSPMAQADLIHVQRASDAELIREAQKNGFDLNKYTQ